MRAVKSQIDAMLSMVEDHAKALALIPGDVTLHITTGHDITPVIGYFPHLPQRSVDLSFLPRFEKGWRTTMTDTYLALSATERALASINKETP